MALIAPPMVPTHPKVVLELVLISLCVAQLVIPKYHGEKLVDIPDEDLAEILVCKAGNRDTNMQAV